MHAKGVTPLWVRFSAAFGVGTLLLTWAVYAAAWMFSVCGKMDNPLFGANITILGLAAAILIFLFYRKWKKGRLNFSWKRVNNVPRKELLFFFILLGVLTWIMFWVFYIKDGRLYCGVTVYGDYAPHTAMIRSFSIGNNFPTQYPHFGGEDVKYHFMFQFLTGNLEYLGLRLDFAYNSVSILSMLGMFMMLYSMAKRVSGKMAAGVLTIFLVMFRSGTAFFQFLYEHWQSNDLWQTLSQNAAFIGYSANENWGLWCFNVYVNQRHLSFGILLAAVAVWIFWDWLDMGCEDSATGIWWLKNRIFSVKAWKCVQPEIALFVGMILGLSAFWNGAALIAGLLILMGFAVFSDGKLDYLITAMVAVLFSILQSKIFVWGDVVSPSIYIGFLAAEKTLPGILLYLFQISGLVFVGIWLLLLFLKRGQRVAAVSMFFPAVFAFVMSLTPDVTVNHKYIMIAYAFVSIFWADALCRLWKWKKRIVGKGIALLLAVFMMLTGFYDFVVVVRGNDKNHRVNVNIESNLTAWLAENFNKDDLILTPEYSINEVTMSGCMMYLGWPYYAWSAGYDTYYRAAQAIEIYGTEDADVLRELVEQEKITYILYEEGMELEQHECREDVIAETYPLVYQSEDGRIRIYETR